MGHYYTGICTDLKRRFLEHQSDGAKCAKSLKGKGPLTLVFAVKMTTHSDALKAEIWVKKQTRTFKEGIVEQTQSLPYPHKKIDVTQVLSSD